jgi:transcriptional regulator with XRE-family HTH domain
MTSIELLDRLDRRREDIGMSKKQLATRARIPIATLNRVLSGKEKRLAIDKIGALAGALGVVVHVGSTMALEELESPFELCQKEAKRKAARVVRMVQGTMGLEAQALDANDVKDMVEQTTCELMAGSRRKLWSE